jgi:hypothetical protein
MHFVGSFIGKGDSEDSVGFNTIANQVGNTKGNDASLPGPRSCQNEKGA